VAYDRDLLPRLSQNRTLNNAVARRIAALSRTAEKRHVNRIPVPVGESGDIVSRNARARTGLEEQAAQEAKLPHEAVLSREVMRQPPTAQFDEVPQEVLSQADSELGPVARAPAPAPSFAHADLITPRKTKPNYTPRKIGQPIRESQGVKGKTLLSGDKLRADLKGSAYTEVLGGIKKLIADDVTKRAGMAPPVQEEDLTGGEEPELEVDEPDEKEMAKRIAALERVVKVQQKRLLDADISIRKDADSYFRDASSKDVNAVAEFSQNEKAKRDVASSMHDAVNPYESVSRRSDEESFDRPAGLGGAPSDEESFLDAEFDTADKEDSPQEVESSKLATQDEGNFPTLGAYFSKFKATPRGPLSKKERDRIQMTARDKEGNLENPVQGPKRPFQVEEILAPRHPQMQKEMEERAKGRVGRKSKVTSYSKEGRAKVVSARLMPVTPEGEVKKRIGSILGKKRLEGAAAGTLPGPGIPPAKIAADATGFSPGRGVESGRSYPPVGEAPGVNIKTSPSYPLWEDPAFESPVPIAQRPPAEFPPEQKREGGAGRKSQKSVRREAAAKGIFTSDIKKEKRQEENTSMAGYLEKVSPQVKHDSRNPHIDIEKLRAEAKRNRMKRISKGDS
jgi:hypothetical protein